jgi:PAS domain S-box-containing protein
MNGQSIKVLLIEDNPGDARLISELLKDAKDCSFDLAHADSVLKGKEYLSGNDPDVILLDLSLPDSSGIGTLYTVLGQTAKVPIILMTGLEDEELAIRTVREGAQDYLVKGQTDERLLIRSILYAIERKRSEEGKRRLEEEINKTEQLKIEASAQKEWQATFNNITDLISIHDRDFNIFRFNRAFADHFGLGCEMAIEKKCYELFHGTCSPIANCPHQRTLDTYKPETENILDPKSQKTIRISTFPFYGPEGELSGSVHIVRDITEEREKEMRLIMSERLAALGQMVSGVAHEINNPLAAIAGCAEGLLNRVKKEKYDPDFFGNYLNIIEEEIIRCKGIVTSVLSFASKGTYEKKEIELHKVLDKTLEIIGFQGRSGNIEIIRDYSEKIPVIQGSEGDLRQVFMALIINAFEAMEDKGKFTIKTLIEGDKLLVKFIDSGPGIEEEYMDRIFDPFFTTKSEKGGTGLGLSVARKIIENHGGSIDISSESGKGATFSISLPVK